MKSKPESPEYKDFSDLLKKVVSVPGARVKAQIEAERQERKLHPKRRVSRASHEKD